MKILTTKEVCSLLRMTRASLYKLIKSGKMPAFRTGRSWRFEHGIVEAWITNQMKESNKEIKK